MDKHTQLIKLYCAVCYHYDNTPSAYVQRLSNNFCPKFTDRECITTLIWGIANQKFDVKCCYEFIKGNLYNIRLFADMSLLDKDWQAKMLAENNVEILTPIKHKKVQKILYSASRLFSSAVSSVKQATESLNNWLIEKTNIQRASKVRSSEGLKVFLFARVACACFLF